MDERPTDPLLAFPTFCADDEPAQEIAKKGERDHAEGDHFCGWARAYLKTAKTDASGGGNANQDDSQARHVEGMDDKKAHDGDMQRG